jgi:hypothetical protein
MNMSMSCIVAIYQIVGLPGWPNSVKGKLNLYIYIHNYVCVYVCVIVPHFETFASVCKNQDFEVAVATGKHHRKL